MNTSDPAAPTLAVANPSDSILVNLARVALAPMANGGVSAWPTLDLNDAEQRQFGDYELIEELGRGGMGVVYRARQSSLDRDVAIKFIADWFADSTNVTRFLAEARAAARLLHPNIVPVHEVGSVEGVHYFSMPLIEGRSLAQVLDDGPMPTDTLLGLMLKLCEAIDYAHRLGLLHLDLKPANVLIDARGEPLVADFGLARHMDAKGGVDAQEVSGTPQFMAPEQILIRQYRLTRATDIYALGAILYLCLTRQSPHGKGAADDVLRRAVAGRVRPPRELNPKIPRDLDAICMRCLELQPGDRYKSAAELVDDLRRVRDGQPVSVRRIGFIERVRRWFVREPRLAIAVTAAMLALVIGAAATTWQWKEAAAQRDRAAIAGEIGAHLFAYSGDNDNRAEDLIAWLRKRLPGNEDRQADALTAFASSVDAEDNSAAVGLMVKVSETLGADYRRQMIQALQAGSDPYRHLYAALLAFRDENTSADPKMFATSLQATIAGHPNDQLVWQVAAVYCPWPGNQPHCLFPQAAETLTRLDPDNMYSWLLLAMTSTSPQRIHDALHEAAKRKHFDDYTSATIAAYVRAISAAALPPPPLIASPLGVLGPNERAESNIASIEASGLTYPSYANLIDQCGVRIGMPPVTDSRILADCLTVGEAMMRSKGSILTQRIGVAVVKTLAKGKPEADEAKQERRLDIYLEDVYEKLTPAQHMRYSSSRWLEDRIAVGEMAAYQRQARFFGFPDQPPDNWNPDDLIVLQSSRERFDNTIALDRDGALLVTQGKYAEALARLAPAETTMRKYFKDNWLLVRYLTALGRSRIGLHQYPAAQTDLHDAFHIVANYGPSSKEARDVEQALVDLYSAWNVTEPANGYDAKASEWQKRLATLEAWKDD